MRQTPSEMADQCPRQGHEAARHAPVVHERPGKDEQRNGHVDEGVRGGGDVEGHRSRRQQIVDPGGQESARDHRKGGRDAGQQQNPEGGHHDHTRTQRLSHKGEESGGQDRLVEHPTGHDGEDAQPGAAEVGAHGKT